MAFYCASFMVFYYIIIVVINYRCIQDVLMIVGHDRYLENVFTSKYRFQQALVVVCHDQHFFSRVSIALRH